MAKFLQLCSALYLRGCRLILTVTLQTFQELYHDMYSLELYHSLTPCLFQLLASPDSEFPVFLLFPAVTINFKQCLIIKSTYIEPGSCLKERLLLLFFCIYSAAALLLLQKKNRKRGRNKNYLLKWSKCLVPACHAWSFWISLALNDICVHDCLLKWQKSLAYCSLGI